MIIRKSKAINLKEVRTEYRWDSLAIKDGREIWVTVASFRDEDISAIIKKFSEHLSYGKIDSWSEKHPPKLSAYDEYFDGAGDKVAPKKPYFGAADVISARQPD